jgi:hypothetical protein
MNVIKTIVPITSDIGVKIQVQRINRHFFDRIFSLKKIFLIEILIQLNNITLESNFLQLMGGSSKFD